MPDAPSLGLLGLPYDASSSFLSGPALAPARIREALSSPSANPYTELGARIDLEAFSDFGDVDFGEGNPRELIEDAVSKALGTGPLLCLGGDHSVTYPIVRTHHRAGHQLTLVHFDAHTDLYDSFEGDRFSHACPFARIMQEGLVRRLIQIGIRTLTPEQREQVSRFGVEVIEMRALENALSLSIEDPVYLSFDLDALDPSCAPGVSHHEPGGMTTREALNILHNLEASIVGADVVELNPHRDPSGVTAMVAAKLVKEIAGLMVTNR